jgi:Insertion element 4 transposase N-terminal/Transposase DDE domain
LSQSVITRQIVVAGGVFAPGHLGELTRIIPFEMVDAVLADCGAVQRRVRKLPARVVVYLLLAAALFEPIGYLAVWRKLTGALDGARVAKVTGAALWQARTRLGPAPLRALFELLSGPAAAPRTSGAWWRGLLVCAIDGTTLDVPDTPGHRARLGKQDNQYATAGYPQLRLVALVACGTRAIIDAVFGPTADGETVYLPRLLRCLHAGMIVLLDRGLSSNALLAAVAGTHADFLARLSASRKPPVLARLPDGSFLSVLGGTEVRIIDCQITIATTAGTRTGTYRLATTLLDHRRYPAFELVKLYHQRWEIEMVFTQLAKGAVRPVSGGWQDVADLGLVLGDDYPVDEQLGQLPPLREGGGGQPGPDGLAECLDPVSDGAEFQLLPGGGVELALLGEQGGVPAV